MELTKYLQKSREERTAHVNLSTSCVLDETVARTTQGRRGRKALLKLLGLENDVPDWKTGRVQCCHVCKHDSQNGWCSNPLHLYVGTPSENQLDLPEELRKEKGKAPHREKDENGKSVNAVKCGKATHREKDEEGKSVNAVKAGKEDRSKGGKTATSQVWVSLLDGFVGHAANVALHNRAVGAETEYRVRLTKEEVENYSPFFEEFEYTTYKSSGRPLRRKARQVPEQVAEELRSQQTQ